MKRRDFLKKTALGTTGAFALPTIVPAHVLGKNAPSNKIHIGQIGYGRIARSHDVLETIKSNDVRYVAVAEVDSFRAEAGKKHIQDFYNKQQKSSKYLDVKLYEDFQEMLMNPDIDAIVISTPDHWHAQPAYQAVLAGKDVYVQKPLSLTIQEGRQVADAVARTGRILQIGSQQRSMPQFLRAAELVRNGRLGKIHTVKIGLPGDPSGGNPEIMPVPKELNYDMWLGETPFVPYTVDRVHNQNTFNGRPGWLRCEQFGAGMITGWGSHHIDSMNWGLGTEYTSPVEFEAKASFPTSGLWNVHGTFEVKAKFANGINVIINDTFPNGVRFEGEDGWLFVTRGNYTATADDPVSKKESKALVASDPKILSSVIGDDEMKLHKSHEQHLDWIHSIKTRQAPVAPAEVGHRACTSCLVSHIAMKLPRKLHWDPINERFQNDDEANSMLSRAQRYPYGIDNIGK
jgi:predicted dehydrogenase